jgi:hypothetical protein
VNNKNQITNPGFSYDASGNLLSDDFLHYTWDAEGRLTKAGGVTCTCDGDGKRMEKSSGTLYFYGTSGDPLVETNGSGGNAKEYVFFGGRRIARRDCCARG